MSVKEATARIKINKLLEAAGWRFFAEGSRELITRFEAKIQATLARVWGEAAPAVQAVAADESEISLA